MSEQEPKPKKAPKFYKADQGLFTPKEIGQVESMAALGCTVEEIATVFRLSKATMERRMSAQPEIYEALQRGRVNAKIKVRKAAYDMASSGKNPFMTQFWLKCKDGWKDRHYVEVNTDLNPAAAQGDIVAEVMGMTEDEISREIETLTLELSAAGNYRLPK